MAVPPVLADLGWRLSRSQHERTRREERRPKLYETSDNLDSLPGTREDARCVEPSVDGIEQAAAIAADYLPRAERHGGPLTRAAAPPLPEPQSALF
jgi:hypothetical protein